MLSLCYRIDDGFGFNLGMELEFCFQLHSLLLVVIIQMIMLLVLSGSILYNLLVFWVRIKH